MKAIVGENVRALIKSNDADVDAACLRLGMKATQVKRVMAGRHAITMTTLERIAAAYDLAPYQLLVPGLDPRNPQVLRQLSPAEAKLYAALEEARNAGTQ